MLFELNMISIYGQRIIPILCKSKYFKEVVLLKKVPKLLTGSHGDTIVPFPTYMYNNCGFVNEEFEVFD